MQNIVSAKPVPRRSIICLRLWFQQIIDLLTTDKSQYFAQSYAMIVNYIPFFPLGNFTRVMSLRDASKKMSKSDPQEMSRIELSDPPDIIKSKIQKAVTDSEKHINYDLRRRPEMANLINIYAEFSGLWPQDICEKYRNMEKCKSTFKTDLTEVIATTLSPVRENVLKIQKDIGYVDSVLRTGADQARDIAETNLMEVKKMIGLR